MSILIKRDTQVMIQGITGKQGAYHAARGLEYGTRIVAGVTPGKGGQAVHAIPVYDTVAEVLHDRPVDASLILVPPAGVLDAALEAIDHYIPLVVIITEFVPFQDSLKIRQRASEKGVIIVGPNTTGVISPGQCRVGIMPGFLYREGKVGIISRSGTLTHEVASSLAQRQVGQSTCVCLGGDAVKGLDFVEALALFRDDPQTEAVVMIGEIGGAGEETAAAYIRETGYPKPVVAFIAGANAPAERRMGHAGAIISGGFGTAASKYAALAAAGVQVARTLEEVYALVQGGNGAAARPGEAVEKEG